MNQTIDILFNANPNDFNGAARYQGRVYSYFVTDEQAREIVEKNIEFAVVQAPGDDGTLKVVKIVGQPSDTPEKATRSIVCLVDLTAYQEAKEREKRIKALRHRMNQRANELAEAARLKALAEANEGDPILREMLAEMAKLQG